jgi:DeoR/GlpR family transcriptional regulator of sugar metabolism
MPEPSEKQSNRAAEILRELRQSGSISVDALSQKLQVSVATVRRDLQDLEARGLLRRTHGGAVPIEPLFYEPFRHDQSFQNQVERFAEEKRRIAGAAAALVAPGNTVAFTAGTTTTEVMRSLRGVSGISVITNTVNVAMELSARKDVDVFVTGGHLRGDWFSLVGPAAVASVRNVFIDVMFIGVNGIDAERGLTCANPDEAEINKAMVLQSKRKIAVTDHSKLGIVTKWLICACDAIDQLITDASATDEAIAPFIKRGVNVSRV